MFALFALHGSLGHRQYLSGHPWIALVPQMYSPLGFDPRDLYPLPGVNTPGSGRGQ